MAKYGAEVDDVVRGLTEVLGPRLVALYRFGTDFARGPHGTKVRLLVLIERIDGPLLGDLTTIAAGAQREQIHLHLETADSLLRSTDVFPILALDLIHTKSLLVGRDVLASLAVDRTHLRLHIERSLRAIHRDLVAEFLSDADDDRRLVRALRRAARKAVYLLEGLLIAAGHDVPASHTPEAIIAAVGAMLPDGEVEAWQQLRRFAQTEGRVDRDHLMSTYIRQIEALTVAIDVVDALEIESEGF